jgi:hypothetical protein
VRTQDVYVWDNVADIDTATDFTRFGLVRPFVGWSVFAFQHMYGHVSDAAVGWWLL